MKRFIIPFILCIILLIVALYLDPITTKVASILEHEPEVVVLPKNEYYRPYDFEFVQNTLCHSFTAS